MRAGTSNNGMAVYPSVMWQVLKILAILGLLATSAFAGDAAKAEALEIQNADGKPVRPFAATADRKAIVLLFITHDCPISNAYVPEVQRIVKEYEARGLALFVVHSDGVAGADAKKHAAEFGFSVPVLLDPECKLAKFSGAHVTPEVALFAPDGALKYLGRIDDKYVDYGKKRPEPTRRDLRIALDEVLAGKPVSMPRAPAVGCYIPNSDGGK